MAKRKALTGSAMKGLNLIKHNNLLARGTLKRVLICRQVKRCSRRVHICILSVGGG